LSRSIHDQAIEILQKTNDGNDLAPEHLKLLEMTVNGLINEAGEIAFEELYQNVVKGYRRPWFHGIEHLTRDHEGYVCWKDTRVDHYSFSDYEQEGRAAAELADICREIEARGGQVTSGNVMKVYDERRGPAPEPMVISGP